MLASRVAFVAREGGKNGVAIAWELFRREVAWRCKHGVLLPCCVTSDSSLDCLMDLHPDSASNMNLSRLLKIINLLLLKRGRSTTAATTNSKAIPSVKLMKAFLIHGGATASVFQGMDRSTLAALYKEASDDADWKEEEVGCLIPGFGRLLLFILY